MSDFKAKMHQFDFRCAPPYIPRKELTALPDPLAVFNGATAKGGRGKGGVAGKGKRSKRKVKGEKGGRGGTR